MSMLPADPMLGLLGEFHAARSLVVVDMGDARFVNFKDQAAIGTANLSGCSVAIVVSAYGAILAHIPPLPWRMTTEEIHAHPDAGDDNVRALMGRVRDLYLQHQAFFPIASTFVICARYFEETEIALPDHFDIMRRAFLEMGVQAPKLHSYRVPVDRTHIGHGTALVAAAQHTYPEVRLQDRLIDTHEHEQTPFATRGPGRATGSVAGNRGEQTATMGMSALQPGFGFGPGQPAAFPTPGPNRPTMVGPRTGHGLVQTTASSRLPPNFTSGGMGQAGAPSGTMSDLTAHNFGYQAGHATGAGGMTWGHLAQPSHQYGAGQAGTSTFGVSMSSWTTPSFGSGTGPAMGFTAAWGGGQAGGPVTAGVPSYTQGGEAGDSAFATSPWTQTDDDAGYGTGAAQTTVPNLTQAGQAGSSSAPPDQDWRKVSVVTEQRLFGIGSVKYRFKDVNGRTVETKREDWVEDEYEGRTVMRTKRQWRNMTYYTHQKIGQ